MQLGVSGVSCVIGDVLIKLFKADLVSCLVTRRREALKTRQPLEQHCV